MSVNIKFKADKREVDSAIRGIRLDLGKMRQDLNKVSQSFSTEKTTRALSNLSSGFEKTAVSAKRAYADMGSAAGRAAHVSNNAFRSMRTELQTLNRQITDTKKSLQSFAIAIGGLAVGAGLTLSFVKISDSITNFENKVAVITGRTEKFTQTTTELYKIALKTRVPLEAVGDNFNRLSLAFSGDDKFNDKDILQAVTAIQTAATISGGSIESLNAAIVQLGQGISNNFEASAQELNSIREQAPRIAKAIADGLGVGVNDLKKLAEEGKISGEAVTRALISQLPTLQKEFSNLKVTVESASQVLKTGFGRFISEINKSIGLTDYFAAKFQNLGNFFFIQSYLIGESIEGIKKKLYSVTTAIGAVAVGLYNKFGKPIVDVMKEIVSGLINEVGGLWQRIKAPFIELYNGIKNLFYDLYIWLVGASIWPDTIDGIVEAPQGLWERIKGSFLELTSGIRAFGKDTLGLVISALTDPLETFLGKYQTFMATWGEAVRKIIITTVLVRVLGTLYFNGLSVKILGVLAAFVWKFKEDLIAIFKDFITGLGKAISFISSSGGLIFNSIINSFVKFFKKLKSLFWDFYIWVVGGSVWPDTIDKIVEYAKNLWSRVKSYFFTFSKNVRAVFLYIYNYLADKILNFDMKAFIENMKADVKSLGNFLIASIKFIIAAINKLSKSAANFFKEKIIGSEIYKSIRTNLGILADFILSLDIGGLFKTAFISVEKTLINFRNKLQSILSGIKIPSTIFGLDINTAVFLLSSAILAIFSKTFRAMASKGVLAVFGTYLFVQLFDFDFMSKLLASAIQGAISVAFQILLGKSDTIPIADLNQILDNALVRQTSPDETLLPKTLRVMNNIGTAIGVGIVAAVSASIQANFSPTLSETFSKTLEGVYPDRILSKTITDQFNQGKSYDRGLVKSITDYLGSTVGFAVLSGLGLALVPSLQKPFKKIFSRLFGLRQIAELLENGVKVEKGKQAIGQNFARRLARNFGYLISGWIAGGYLADALGYESNSLQAFLVKAGTSIGGAFVADYLNALGAGLLSRESQTKTLAFTARIARSISFLIPAVVLGKLVTTYLTDYYSGPGSEIFKNNPGIVFVATTIATALGAGFLDAILASGPGKKVLSAVNSALALAFGSNFSKRLLRTSILAVSYIFAGFVGYSFAQQLKKNLGIADNSLAGWSITIASILSSILLVPFIEALSLWTYSFVSALRVKIFASFAKVGQKVGAIIFGKSAFKVLLGKMLGVTFAGAGIGFLIGVAIDETLRRTGNGLSAEASQNLVTNSAIVGGVAAFLAFSLGRSLKRAIPIVTSLLSSGGWKVALPIGLVILQGVTQSLNNTGFVEAYLGKGDTIGRLLDTIINTTLFALGSKIVFGGGKFKIIGTLIMGSIVFGMQAFKISDSPALSYAAAALTSAVTGAFLTKSPWGALGGAIVGLLLKGMKDFPELEAKVEEWLNTIRNAITKLKETIFSEEWWVKVVIGEIDLFDTGVKAFKSFIEGVKSVGHEFYEYIKELFTIDFSAIAKEFEKNKTESGGSNSAALLETSKTVADKTIDWAVAPFTTSFWLEKLELNDLAVAVESQSNAFWTNVWRGIVDSATFITSPFTTQYWLRLFNFDEAATELDAQSKKFWSDFGYGFTSTLDLIIDKVLKLSSTANQITIPKNTNPYFSSSDFLPPIKKASGGYISGPGTGTSDSILARLSNGEYVINSKSTKRFRPLLDKINGYRNGGLVGYATGGKVNTPASGNFDYGAPTSATLDKLTQGKFFDGLVKAWKDSNVGQYLEETAQSVIGLGDSASKAASTTNGLTSAAKGLSDSENKAIESLKNRREQLDEAFKNITFTDSLSFKEKGVEFAQSMRDSFNSSISDFLKGKSSFKNMIGSILDTFASGIIDAFVDTFTKSMFKKLGLDKVFANIGESISASGANAGGGIPLGGGFDLSKIFSSIFSGIGNFFNSIFTGFFSFLGFASGGLVRGPGSGTSDSILAALSNGEYVVNAQAAKQFKPILDAMNYNKKIPAFAKGGQVGIGKNSSIMRNIPSRSESSQQFVINITGDVSSQTRQEIARMLPEIATGVNIVNKERGSR